MEGEAFLRCLGLLRQGPGRRDDALWKKEPSPAALGVHWVKGVHRFFFQGQGSPKPPRPGPRLGVQFFFFQAAAKEGPVWVSGGFGGLPNRPGRGPG